MLYIQRWAREREFLHRPNVVKSVASENDCMRVQDDLNSICGWSVDWKVFVNALKCAHLHFSLVHSESQAEYEISNSLINYSTSYQDLDIWC